MGSSESKSKPNPTQNLSHQAFLQKWPQNARGFSGNPRKDRVYVAIKFDFKTKTNKTWQAFETRDEAVRCLKVLHNSVYNQIEPYVYYDPSYENSTYWVSVVSRKQARAEGLYCGEEEEEENPEEDTSDAAAENPEGHPAGIPEPSAPGFDMSAFGIRK